MSRAPNILWGTPEHFSPPQQKIIEITFLIKKNFFFNIDNKCL